MFPTSDGSFGAFSSIESVDAGPVDLHIRRKIFADEFRDMWPDSGAFPFRQPVPACHAGTTTEFARQSFEGRPRRKQIQDSCQDLSIGEPFATRPAPAPRFRWRQNWGDSLPQIIINLWNEQIRSVQLTDGTLLPRQRIRG